MVNPFLAGIIILIVVAADIWGFDQDEKRWGWFKGWPKAAKISIFSGLTIALTTFYVLTSLKYI